MKCSIAKATAFCFEHEIHLDERTNRRSPFTSPPATWETHGEANTRGRRPTVPKICYLLGAQTNFDRSAVHFVRFICHRQRSQTNHRLSEECPRCIGDSPCVSPNFYPLRTTHYPLKQGFKRSALNPCFYAAISIQSLFTCSIFFLLSSWRLSFFIFSCFLLSLTTRNIAPISE